jgi:(E)-4-hydroxy-3-methylbut-2-enyl-diphosphate synthase
LVRNKTAPPPQQNWRTTIFAVLLRSVTSCTMDNQHYCNSLTRYSRFVTREVSVGDVKIGGQQPIRIQSMTTTDTMNTSATVEQCIRMIEAGCELVRITAPSLNEARNLAEIKKELRTRGYSAPLIADIHFTPNAAELAARLVEKVRVNPGNYADKKKFEQIDYTDAGYTEELERIRTRFLPLVKICKEYGTAMRIGTNHGSLSDRIMSRYGDSPLGMVESALEFVRICAGEGYHNLVLSMKASNPQVMVQAYRLLVSKMRQEGMNYPLHLGVTEAGEGEDGRIKSAVGIGTLLEDGLGDTIRVSLTEEPELEAPVAIALVQRYKGREQHSEIKPLETNPINPFSYTQRITTAVKNTGGINVPRVIASLEASEKLAPSDLLPLGYSYSQKLDKWNLGDRACDFIYTGSRPVPFEIPGTLRVICDFSSWISLSQRENVYPLFSRQQFTGTSSRAAVNFLSLSIHELDDTLIALLKNEKSTVLVLETSNLHGMAEQRRAFAMLMEQGCETPVVIRRSYSGLTASDFQLYSSTDAGALLVDGLGDGLWLTAEGISPETVNNTAFGILQATRTRISKTEYISCPSCGRTLFDLQETTARIRRRTDHLKGVKIGIMGCIVNGPGEMADADYGYVGTGAGKITLYRGKTVVKKSIDSDKAVDALIELIREDGRWIEKEAVEELS